MNTEAIPTRIPSALPRSSAGKVVMTIAIVAGISSAPPTPCPARAAISMPSFWDAPQRHENATKITAPSTNIRRRPNRSASRPPAATNAASVSRKEFTTHWSSTADMFRSRPIVGSVTPTIVWSMKIIDSPPVIAASVHHLRFASVIRIRPDRR